MNGFEVLKFFESPRSGLASDYNNEITAADEGFHRLLIWIDGNHNGISEGWELQSASDAGLQQISLDYRENLRRDQHGNELRQQGTTRWLLDGQERIPKIVDVVQARLKGFRIRGVVHGRRVGSRWSPRRAMADML